MEVFRFMWERDTCERPVESLPDDRSLGKDALGFSITDPNALRSHSAESR